MYIYYIPMDSKHLSKKVPNLTPLYLYSSPTSFQKIRLDP